MRRSDVVLVLALLSLGVLCIRLGFWQLDRLGQRRARNSRMEEQLSLPRLELTGEALDPAAQEFRRVSATGRLDLSAQVILINRALDGVPGVHLVCPLRLDGSEAAVLVDRGWVPVDEAESAARAAYDWDGPIEVEGIARLSQPEPIWEFLRDPTAQPGGPPVESWRLVNLERIQAQLPYPLLPIYIQQTEPTGGGRQPVPDPEIDRSEGPHLSYAIQWFSFAAIALVGGAAWLRRRSLAVPDGRSG